MQIVKLGEASLLFIKSSELIFSRLICPERLNSFNLKIVKFRELERKIMSKFRILIDMDGVLCDWERKTKLI